MSVVVAIKYDNGVVIGADKQATAYWQFKEQCTKLKKFSDSKIAIGHVGSGSDWNPIEFTDEIVDYKDIFKNETIDLKYIYLKIVPTLKSLFEAVNLITEKNGRKYIDSSFMIVTKDLIVEMSGDFSIYEFDFYHSTGCGLAEANGYLNVMLDGKEPNDISKDKAIQLVKDAVQKGCKDDCYVGMGIDLFILDKDD